MEDLYDGANLVRVRPPNGSGRRQCTATSKRTHQPCRASAIVGGTVCVMHGGRAPQVRRKAAERLADLIDPERLIRHAAYLAYSDIGQVVDEQGRIKPIKDWPPELRAAVAGIEVTKRNLTAGDGAQEDVVKLKLWDKPASQVLLARLLGMLHDKLEVEVTTVERRRARLDAARARNALLPARTDP